MKKFDEILENTYKIKPFDYSARHCGLWYDVCSINRKNRTIRLYNEYGVYETNLDDIEELKKQENVWD